jgi:hypothetical protein
MRALFESKSSVARRGAARRAPLLVVALLGASATASAQSAPEISEGAMVARRALVERAQEASRAGNHEQAASLAESAGRIEMSPSLRLFIAQERVSLGRHASAMEAAELCVREASRSPALVRREQIITACRLILNTSQRHVVLLTLTMPAARRAGFVLRVDGRALSEVELNLPVALDAGTHVVEAGATDAELHRESLRGAPGETLAFTVPARFAADAATTSATSSATAGAATTGATAGGATTGTAHTNSTGAANQGASSGATVGGEQGHEVPDPPAAPPPEGFFARVGAGPFVVGGAGVALLAVSGALAAVAQGELSRAGCRVRGNEILCNTPEQASAFAANAPGTPDPYTPTTAAQISVIAGAALVVGAGIWLGVAASRAPRATEAARDSSSVRQRTAWLVPSFDARSGAVSLSVGGSF